MSRLFETTQLGTLDLPNRLVMAPMTRNRADADGVPQAIMATYYGQRASAGLIIAEAATPNAVGQTYPNITAIHSDAHVAGWRQVTDAVHAAGGRMFLQLQHGGRVGHPDTSGLTPVAPSPVPLPDTIFTPSGHQCGRRATRDDPRRDRLHRGGLRRGRPPRRRQPASRAWRCTPPTATSSTSSWRRAPTTAPTPTAARWPSRIRFVVEVVEAVAAEIGPERVGVRIAPGLTVNGIDEGDTEDIYPALVDALTHVGGLAYLHVVFADPEQAVFQEIRKNWPGTLIANPVLGWGGPLPADGGRQAGERLLAAGADLISLGRSFLANPDLVERMRIGAPLNPVREKGLMYTGGEAGYTDYPVLAEAQVPVLSAP